MRDVQTSLLCLRHATEADIPALVELVTSAYRGEVSRAGWTTEADFLDGSRIDAELLRQDLTRPHSLVIVAENGNLASNAMPLACAHVAEEDGSGYFGMFSVRPALQNSGIGKRLLAEAERIVRDDWRLPAMRMGVIDLRTELIAFYVRRGYRHTGRYEPFPYGDPRFGLPKRDDLRFAVLEKPLTGSSEFA